MTVLEKDTKPEAALAGPPKLATQTLIAALTITAISDRLLFDAPVGLSLFLVAALTGAAALLLHRLAASHGRLMLAGLLYGLGVLPILEHVSALSVCVMLALFALGSLTLADGLRGSLFEKLKRILWFAAAIPVTAPAGVAGWRRQTAAVGEAVFSFARIGVWLMPLAVGLVFIALFQEANPIIADWLRRIDFWAVFDVLNPARILFALLAFTVAFAYLKPHVRTFGPAKPAQSAGPLAGATAAQSQTIAEVLFGEAAILRALIVFNLLFAVETLLDLAYLTGGAALPDGMSYAQYAHRGAYPLVVTALLAAVFVLLALRSGSAARANSRIRFLVYLWIGQNMLLTGSAVLRLDLYVSEYGLTHWRAAAFIWMALVGFGLAAIVWRIFFGKSAEWLVGINLASAALALYGSCFIDFSEQIASYNIRHGRDDFHYLTSLGAAAIPAIDTAIKAGRTAGAAIWIPDDRDYLWEMDGQVRSVLDWRMSKAGQFAEDYADWRGFTLRKWRLSRYLASHPLEAARLHGRIPEDRR